MRLLVTRPLADAAGFVAALEAAGHAAVVAPLLRISIRTRRPDLTGVQALVFTSANGVRAFAANAGARGLPVFAVGARTAEEAEAAGFARVTSAAGDVESLAALLGGALDPADGAVLHVAGSAVAGDLAGALQAAGFDVRREVLYDAIAADALPQTASDALRDPENEGGLDGVTFFSPRTAESFARLVRAAGLARTTEGLTAWCLSDAVAAKARDLPWTHVRVAAAPTQDALLAAIGTAGPPLAGDPVAGDPVAGRPTGGPGARRPTRSPARDNGAGHVGTTGTTGDATTTEDGAMADHRDKRDEDGAAKPGASKPEAGKPETGKPETGKLETGRPDASNKPEASKPEGAKPEGGKPEGGKPTTSVPTTAKPGEAKVGDKGPAEPLAAPVAAGPGDAEPGGRPAGVPEAKDPGVSESGVSGSGASGSGASGSGASGSGASGSGASESGAGEPGNVAETVIHRFGGLRPTASKLGVAVSTVQGWKARGQIPAARHDELRAAAAEHKVDISDIDLEAEAEAEKRAAKPGEIGAEDGIKGSAATGGQTTELSGVTTAAGPNPFATGDDKGAKTRDDESEAEAAGVGKPAVADRPGSPGAAKTGTRSSVPPSAMPPPPPPKGGSGSTALGFVLALVLFAVGAVAAAYTRDLWEPYLSAGTDTTDQELADLRERLLALEQAQGQEGQGADPQRVDALESQLTDLAAQVAEAIQTATNAAATAEDAQAAAQGAGTGVAGGADPQALGDIEQRLGQLEQQVAAASSGDGGQAAPAIDPAMLSGLQDTIAALESDLATLRQDTQAGTDRAASALRDEVAALQAEIQDLAGEAEAAARTRRDGSGLALALGQLRDALRFAAPFEPELAAVRALVGPDDPLQGTLETLSQSAGSGVPTREELQERFDPMAELVVANSYDDSWTGRLMSRVSQAVSVRPVGEVEGDSARARIARAEARMQDGNLAGAIEALQGLQGDAAEAAQPWVADAQARLAAEEALADLTRRTLARLTNGDAQARDEARDEAGDQAGGDAPASE